MKTIGLKELRALLPDLEEVTAKEGIIVITKHGEPIAQIEVPFEKRKPIPSHMNYLRKMKKQKIPTSALIREDRDAGA